MRVLPHENKVDVRYFALPHETREENYLAFVRQICEWGCEKEGRTTQLKHKYIRDGDPVGRERILDKKDPNKLIDAYTITCYR